MFDMRKGGGMLASRPSDAAAIPFCRPAVSEKAVGLVMKAIRAGALTGGGTYTAACHHLLRRAVPGGTPFLTSSCTDALELAALALDLRPGDEVVVPSWTFPSTANAIALRGATPVFVDVEAGTLNIDVRRAAEAVTRRTRAIVCVHYAGVACDMGALLDLCRTAGLVLVEDAAQAYGSFWQDRALGGIGDLGAFSFHGTKNVSSGEAGALIVRGDALVGRAEIAWEKGTNRLRYLRGEVDTYEWCDLGSSFLPSEITAAFLCGQLEEAARFTHARLEAWSRYMDLFGEAALGGAIVLPTVPAGARHNGHIFAVRVRDVAARDVIGALAAEGIDARTHYRPLHSSPGGRRFGRSFGPFPVTDAACDRLVRLPLDTLISAREQERIVDIVVDTVRGHPPGRPRSPAASR